MQKQIKQQTQKMWLVMIVLGLLTYWQIGFVWKAIDSNIYMNGTIIVAFFGSCVLAFMKVYALKKDVIALHALQEMWDDVRATHRDRGVDPFFRHYRALKPGIVFETPKILGHAFDLVVDEIARTGRMRIGVASMSTLVHKIDAKLADERSILNYMSGLLVFLGLIGAFLGLLKMVSSIGGILGGLSSAGGGGGSNADAFNKLLTDLQAPLGGMATGFASSLFGLAGSLVVGLLARFCNDAATTIKHEFENWLASVSQIEGEAEEDKTQTHAGPLTVARVDPQFAQIIGAGMARSNALLQRSAQSMEALADEQRRQSETLARLAGHVGDVAGRQAELQAQVGLVQALGAAVQDLRGEVSRMERGLDNKMTQGLTELARHQNELARTMAALQLGGVQPQSLEAMQGAMVEGFGKISKVLDASNRAVAHGLMQVAQVQAAQKPAAASSGADLAHLIDRLDHNMAAGLTQVSHSVEQAFLAYAQLLKAGEALRVDEPFVEETAPDAPTKPAAKTPAGPSDAEKVVHLNRFYAAAHDAYVEAKATAVNAR